jgi:hypothetical protein
MTRRQLREKKFREQGEAALNRWMFFSLIALGLAEACSLLRSFN